MRHLLSLLAASLCALALGATAAHASIVVRLDLEALTERATVVAVGTVLDTNPHWTEDGYAIVTDVRLQVGEAIKGTSPGAVVEFRVLGGSVGNLAQTVAGEPAFVAGEEALVFLEPRGDGAQLGVVGMSQGKFTIEHTGDAAIAVQATGDLALADVAPAPGVAAGATGPQIVTAISAPPPATPRALAPLLDELRGFAATTRAP